VVLAILLPIALLLTSVRVLLTRPFVRLDYAIPGFPPDPFGFTSAERVRWANVALEYLLNDSGVEFLGNLHFENGNAVYNERELRHMVDVKRLVQRALWVWGLALAGTLVLAVVLWRLGGEATMWSALRQGATATLLLMVALVALLLATFSFVFIGFHRIFFEGDTWLFLYSDTLIRLFPERFWQAAFMAIGLATVAQALLVSAVARWRLRRA
jgi:integral membrane protein (TIGR01906 family)